MTSSTTTTVQQQEPSATKTDETAQPTFPVMQMAQGENLIEYFSSNNDDDNKQQTLKSVRTIMNYVTPDTQEINIYRDVSGSDSNFTGAKFDCVDLVVKNARLSSPTLHQEGFELVQDPVVEDKENNGEIDFLNSKQVIEQYYPQCEQLLQRILGPKAICIKAFDHNIRRSARNGSTNGEKLKGSSVAKTQMPVGMVHGDYTKESGPQRISDLSQPPKANDVLREYLPENQSSLLDPQMVKEAVDEASEKKRRFLLVNVWRNTDRQNPVQEFPLGCMDSSTFTKDDLRTLKIHYTDRIGQNYFVKHESKHDWAYFPQMTFDEALLIKQWDSFGSFAKGEANDKKEESYCSTFSIHSGFMDPTSTPEVPPRQSVEVRCVIIYEQEEEETAT